MNLPRRIRKWLRDATHFSVEEIISLLDAGRITVSISGHAPATVAEETLIFDEDSVFLDGEKVVPVARKRGAFLLFKPKGVIVTASDPEKRSDLKPWLETLPPGYFPVGRLDRETTGALLFVNDGDLATAILRPEHHLDKQYWLWLNESLEPEDPRLVTWTEGMPLLKGTARASAVRILNATDHYTEMLVVLREGKNRQLRRMCRQSDFRLLHLHRRSIGPIDLRGMAIGQIRELRPLELELLWQSAGGQKRVISAQVAALRRKAEEARSAKTPLVRLERWLNESSPC